MGRILFLTLFSCATTILILASTALRGALGGWVIYTSVFPISVAVGTYRKEVRETLNHFLRKSQIIYLLLVFLCLYLYFSTIRIYKTPDLIFSWRYAALLILAVQPVTFILAVLMLSHLADIFKVNSKFLMWLGEHSLEIFLVHLPFIVFYDFFLFRKPLFLFFPLYLLFIFALGYSLKKLTSFLDTLFIEAPARNRSTPNI